MDGVNTSIVFGFLVAVCSFAPEITAAEEMNAGTLAMRASKYWQCAAYEAFAKIEESRYRALVDAGIDSARESISLAMTDVNQAESFNSGAPVYFKLSVGGPSADFVVGRWFEIAMSSANKSIREITGGLEISWSEKEELWTLEGKNRYRDANCDFLLQ